MATKARFGRLPRSAPSLTSTIVSLAQEYQHTRDRNIEDAWKNGGSFEGKKVTDKMLQDHWKQRRSEVSQDDPMWDYYNNTISQLDFNIEESKMGQKYAEEKVTDGQMAAFYRKWAAKLPQDSQIYRQLMTQAAKFKSAANARGRGRASNAAAQAYAKKQGDTYHQYEEPFDTATSIIANFALQRNLLDPKDLADPDHGWSKLTEASAEHDPERFVDLLSDIMADDTTRKAMTAVIKQIDPDFNGKFDEESMARLANNAGTGARIRQDRAHKYGDTKGETDAKKRGAGYGKNTMILRAVLGNNAEKGFVEVNEQKRAALDHILGDPSRTPSEQRDALDDYQTWLSTDALPNFVKLFPAGSFDPFSPNFNADANGLVARMHGTVDAAMGKPQGQTLKDDLFGFSTAEAGTSSDAAKLGEQAGGIRTNMDMVDNSQGMVVRVDSHNNIDPNGKQWAIFKNDDPDIAKVEVVPFAVPSDNYTGGEVRYTATEPVRVAVYGGIDPNTRKGVGEISADDMSDPNIGSRIEIEGPGGQKYTLWGVQSGGEKVWTVDNPFTEAGKGTEGRDDRGNWVVGYVDPEAAKQKGVIGGNPTFNPSSYINQDSLKRRIWDPNGGSQPGGGGFIDSTDGKPWDPTQDKELAHYSPLSALANSSAASLKWLNNMGPNAVAKAETEWYAKDPARWNPDMKRMAAQGAKPEDVVAAGSRMLANDIAQKNREGITPEQQQASRRSEAFYQAGRAGASQGLSIPAYQKKNQDVADTQRRGEIAAQMNKWGSGTMVAGPRGTVSGQPYDPHAGEVPLSQKWTDKGWTIGELLNQPGMSVDQANDLAAIISGGAVGQRLQGTKETRVLPGNQPGWRERTTQPPPNPYAPAGVVPVKPPAKYVAPVPPPKPTVAPAPTTSYVPPSQTTAKPPNPRNQHGATEFDF